MKAHLLLVGFLLAAAAGKAQAQEGVVEMKVTEELRKKFMEEAHLPDPSQIVSVTPPQLLKPSAVILHDPVASQIVTETPASLRKRSLAAPAPSEPQK